MEEATEPGFTLMSLYEELSQRFKGERQAEPSGRAAFLTTRELAEAFGVGIDSIRAELRKIHAQGRLEVTKKEIICLGTRGRMQVDAYRIKLETEE